MPTKIGGGGKVNLVSGGTLNDIFAMIRAARPRPGTGITVDERDDGTVINAFTTPVDGSPACFLRFWNMLAYPYAASQSSTLSTAAGYAYESGIGLLPANGQQGYDADFPAGINTVIVTITDGRQFTLSVDLEVGKYYTVVLIESGLALLDDNLTAADPLAVYVRPFCFVPGWSYVGSLDASLYDDPDAALLFGPVDYGTNYLPVILTGITDIGLKGTAPDGTSYFWTVDVDASLYRMASILNYFDPYGRFRPRVTQDGPPR